MELDTSDPARLVELHSLEVLDTEPEEGFDDIVQISRLICQTPVALISLVDRDRQWFKARSGFAECETDLRSSVCIYALREPELLVIPDLTQDPRTRSNPLVTEEPKIRFYAGAPLRTEKGLAIGSLCVIDTAPRIEGLSEAQADGLKRLAHQVVVLLRERRQLARLIAAGIESSAAAARRTALLELGDHLHDVSSVADMTAKAAEIVGRTLNASRTGYGDVDPAGEILTLLKDWTRPGIAGLSGNYRFADFGAITPVIKDGAMLVIRDVAEDARTAERAAAYATLDIRALLNVPVRERGRTVGLFLVHDTKPRAWAPEEIAFCRNVADRVQIGIARLRAEERQDMLNRELSHRMRNTIAMVQAIAMQTFRNAPDLDSARVALSDRLVAMGRAHDLLLSGMGEAAGLEAVIKGALAIHDDRQFGRLRLDGPDVQVGSSAALSLALMFHELATNAVKYGALSVPGGSISVVWRSFDKDGEPHLRLTWIEHGGPPVREPTRRSFGTRLIERGLDGILGAEVTLAYPQQGVTCTAVIPQAGLAEEA